jgi:hypothetical protein
MSARHRFGIFSAVSAMPPVDKNQTWRPSEIEVVE